MWGVSPIDNNSINTKLEILHQNVKKMTSGAGCKRLSPGIQCRPPPGLSSSAACSQMSPESADTESVLQ